MNTVPETLQEDAEKIREKQFEIGLQVGYYRGRQDASVRIILAQLKRRQIRVRKASRTLIYSLCPELLEELGLAILDFRDEKELSGWLQKKAAEPDATRIPFEQWFK